MKKLLLTAALTLVAATACDRLDDTRIPTMPVYIPFQTQAQWELCGAVAAGDYVYFIKDSRLPSNYSWTAASYSGYGGVLLVCDYLGNPLAYDLSCPVERKTDVRIKVEEDMYAHCPKCGSVYQVFSNYGSPMSGKAAEEGYALQRYYVGAGQSQYMIVSR